MADDQTWRDDSCPYDLPGLKNDEGSQYFVSLEEDDPTVIRKIHGIAKCIRHHECSSGSWQKHRPWSLKSKWQACSYLKYHLMSSGKHQMSDYDAQQAIEDAWMQEEIEFTENDETWDDREAYRRAVQTSKRAQGPMVPQKRKHDEASGSHEAPATDAEMQMNVASNQVQLEVPVEQWNSMNGMMQTIVRLPQ